MCGEMIGEFQGKAIGMRILELFENGPKIEVSGQLRGTLLGIDAEGMGTGLDVWLSPDTLYGEVVGVITSKSGEMAMFNTTCVGKTRVGNLAGTYLGMIYFRSSTPKWSRLTGKAVVYEETDDDEGNFHWKLWEWKENK